MPTSDEPTNPFPGTHRDNLLQSLLDELSRLSDAESISLPMAFSRSALRWLGEDSDGIERFTDGSADRGLDAYRINPDSIVVYQFKGRDSIDRDEVLKPANVDALADVSRILNLIAGRQAVENANPSIKRLMGHLRSYLRAYKEVGALSDEGATTAAANGPLITLKSSSFSSPV